mgnify:FL=1
MAQRFFRNIENIYRGARHFGLIGNGDQRQTATKIPDYQGELPSAKVDPFDASLRFSGSLPTVDIEAAATREPRNNVFNDFFDQQANEENQRLKALQAQTGSVSSLNFDTGRGIPKQDWRARIRPKNSDVDDNPYFQGKLLAPIRQSGGLVFQYTPDIFVSGTANWNSTHGVGQNYPVWTYNNSTPPSLPIISSFTANTEAEARYMLAVLHWCRGITKSSFGEQDYASNLYGTPPPVLYFEYLGKHGFKQVPVIVSSYSYSYPNNVDYVPVRVGTSDDDITFLPVKIDVTINMDVAFTPEQVRRDFSIGKFIRGEAYDNGFI